MLTNNRDWQSRSARITTACIGLIAFLFAMPAVAEPIYSISICGGSSAPTPESACYVQSVTTAPPPGSLDGLTKETILNFLISYLDGTYLSELNYGIMGANSSGYVWGFFEVLHSFLPMFVFQNGEILCCIMDGPWRNISINNNGLVIGKDPHGMPFISIIESPMSLFRYSKLPSLDDPSLELLAGFAGNPFYDFWQFSHLIAIDDANRVSGFNSHFGAFLLTPIEMQQFAARDIVDTLPIPEPSTGLLVLGPLALIGLLWRRVSN